MVNRLSCLAVIAGALVTLASCSGTPSATGAVSGSVYIVAGGVEYRTVHGGGNLAIREGKRLVTRVPVSSGHPFNISLPVGTYEITVGTPNATCQSGDILTQVPRLGPVTLTVNVTENKASKVSWSCRIPSAVG
jgi:hypothetical protein